MKLRILLAALALAAAGCPRPRADRGPTVVDPIAHPAGDLVGAGDGTPAEGGNVDPDDHRLKVVDLDVIHLDQVDGDIHARTAWPLLEKGNAAFDAGKHKEAAGWYRKLVTDFPDSKLSPVALYNMALSFERLGDMTGAIATYRELLASYPEAPAAIDGGLRVAAISAEREQWKEAGDVLQQLSTRTDLTKELRLEVLARLGYVQLEQGQLDAAETALNDAVSTWRRASRVEDPYYIAMAFFYLGEINERRFQAQPVRSADEQLSADMRTKRELLMKAYEAWKAALPFNVGYFSTAAGYQMSQVFYEYWKAAVRAPFPDGMSEDARPLYTKEVHERVRENLVKALDGHRANVELAGVLGVESVWSKASEQRIVELMAVLDREARGELVTPSI